MRQWSDNHPQGKLLARKRAAIVQAAQEVFLQQGYEGASMESIAQAAGVSIMTLYRHARRKEDLFAAIIADACDHSSEEKQAEIREMERMPLGDMLAKLGVMFQEKWSDPAILALLRVVIMELKRFPQLADTVYAAFFLNWTVHLDAFLARRTELQGVEAKRRRKLCEAFFDRLVGLDAFRLLLGIKGSSKSERTRRARAASAALLAELRDGA